MDAENVKDVAHQTGEHDAVTAAARVGFAVNGLMHLLIGWIALQLAWGLSRSGSGSADQAGALSTLATNGLGRAILWVGVAGFLGLGIWQLAACVAGPGGRGGQAGQAGRGDRIKAGAKGLLYTFLSWTALTFARGGSSSSKEQSKDFTASLMSKPFGTVLVVLLGLTVIGIGVYHVIKGWQRKFLRDLESHPGRAVERLARFGYIAKGLALIVVGVLFELAAAHNNPDEATGLDGALRTLLDAPYGRAVLTVTALGFGAFGIYSFVRARAARV